VVLALLVGLLRQLRALLRRLALTLLVELREALGVTVVFFYAVSAELPPYIPRC